MSGKQKNRGSAGRLQTAVLLTATVVLLSACEMRVKTSLLVSADGSGTITQSIALDDQLAEMLESSAEAYDYEGEISDGLFGDDWVPDGWDSETIEEDGYRGVSASISFSDLDDLSQRLNELDSTEEYSLSSASLTKDGNVFRFRLVVPPLDEGSLPGQDVDTLNIEDDPALWMLDTVLNYSFVLELPGEILVEESNADRIEGQSLIWDDLLVYDSGGRVLEAASRVESPTGAAIIFWSVAGVSAVALAYLIVDRLKHRRAKRERVEHPNGNTDVRQSNLEYSTVGDHWPLTDIDGSEKPTDEKTDDSKTGTLLDDADIGGIEINPGQDSSADKDKEEHH